MPGILIIKVPISRFSLSQTETQDVFYPIQANAVFAQANQAVDVDVDVAVDVAVDVDVDVAVDVDVDVAVDADVVYGAQSSDEIAAARSPSPISPLRYFWERIRAQRNNCSDQLLTKKAPISFHSSRYDTDIGQKSEIQKIP